jgi:glyoxylase-like metal-dependent hydrolase (beta-lactamase superfamily II)
MLKIKMYPAGNGDAFLVSGAGANVLVDGGYASTFDRHIAADLQALGLRGERLNLLIATHIDADHISGLIALLAANGSSIQPVIVPTQARREALLAHARTLPDSAGATSPHAEIAVRRALAPVVEPAMQLLRQVWRAWRAELWELPASSPRIWAI